MEKKDWEQRIVDYSADLMDKHFPKGECKERGKALVFNAKLITYVMGELDRAREEGRREGFIFGYGKGEHSMSEFLEHKWDIPHSSRMSAIPDEEIDKALESLTKLTTK